MDNLPNYPLHGDSTNFTPIFQFREQKNLHFLCFLMLDSFCVKTAHYLQPSSVFCEEIWMPCNLVDTRNGEITLHGSQCFLQTYTTFWEKTKRQQLKGSVSMVLSRRTSKDRNKEKGQSISSQDSLSSSSKVEKTNNFREFKCSREAC